jgi:hypothetical protein
MEDIVNFPCFREVKSISDMGDFGSYPKGSVPPWCKFWYSFYSFQVCSF